MNKSPDDFRASWRLARKAGAALGAMACVLALPSIAAGPASDSLGATVSASGDVAAGKRVFAKCAECHTVGPSARSGFGPQLNGIVGRPAATATDYRYSAALANSKIVWNESTLRAFIRSPGDVVPGTKMIFWGLGNERQITDLLAYLRSFPATTGAAP